MKEKHSGAAILLVEDDDALRASLQRDLERAGYRVLTAEHGNAALTVHNSEHIDVIVTDIMMPEKDGIELIMELKKESANANIIAITGTHSDDKYLRIAKMLGADLTLEKPFLLTDLVQAIELTLTDNPFQSA